MAYLFLILGVIGMTLILGMATAEPQCSHKFSKWQKHQTYWQRRECEDCGFQEERRIQ